VSPDSAEDIVRISTKQKHLQHRHGNKPHSIAMVTQAMKCTC